MRLRIQIAPPLLLIAPLVATLLATSVVAAQEKRHLTTDEPRKAKGKPDGAADYVPKVRPTDGQHLALTMQKLERGIDPPRPFLIWALGSSYCNMLGNGEAWKEEIPKRFPNAPPIEYRKMVGNSCPWQYLRGWARHLVIPDQPDLVLIYTIGNPDDLEKLIIELRENTTADIIVPSIHWRERDQELWGKSENAADQDVGRVRAICRKHDVEFIESRADWGAYLAANKLAIPDLLKDAVHQSDYGAKIINANIFAHVRRPTKFCYDPASREKVLKLATADDGSVKAIFTGNRIDLIGRKSPAGGTVRVLIDGKPADQLDAFLVSYVKPGSKNSKERVGTSPTVPRDTAPHGITLGTGVVPQLWKITMTSDSGDYTLKGSITSTDGKGNAFEPFTSNSDQILIGSDLWRRAERNRVGDTFSFEVRRTGIGAVSFHGTAGEQFVVRLAEALHHREHKLELVPQGDGGIQIEALRTFTPPLK